jgi:hypothetical protein
MAKTAVGADDGRLVGVMVGDVDGRLRTHRGAAEIRHNLSVEGLR